QHRYLLAGAGGRDGRTQRDLGLSETDVAADHAVHRLRRGKVGQYRVDCSELVGRLLETEAFREARQHRAVVVDGIALAGRTLRMDRQQFRGGVADFFGRLALGALPRFAAQRMQWCVFVVCTAVAADQTELRDGHVQLVAPRVLDGEELARHAADVECHQAEITADAVIDVHDRCADFQLREIAQDGFRIAFRDLPAAVFAARAFTGQLAFGESHDRWLREHEAAFQRRDCDGKGYSFTVIPGVAQRRYGIQSFCLVRRIW